MKNDIRLKSPGFKAYSMLGTTNRSQLERRILSKPELGRPRSPESSVGWVT